MQYQLYTHPDQPLAIPTLEGEEHHALLRVRITALDTADIITNEVWDALKDHLRSMRVQVSLSTIDSVELIMTDNPFEGIVP